MIPSYCRPFSSKFVFRSDLLTSKSTGSSSIFGGLCAGVIVSMVYHHGLGGSGGKKGSLLTGNLYPGCLGEGLLPKGGMDVGGGFGLSGNIGLSAGLGFICSIVCNFGPTIFLQKLALPCPFLGSTGWIIFVVGTQI